MIIWTIKLLSNLRRAIAGRRYPSQLAWAVAFGLLLGIVPHGNVLAVLLLVLVLTLKLNHAMAGLTAIAANIRRHLLGSVYTPNRRQSAVEPRCQQHCCDGVDVSAGPVDGPE